MDKEERLRGLSQFVVYLFADVQVHHYRTPGDYGAVPELVELLKEQKYIKMDGNCIVITKKGKNLYNSLLDRVGEEVDFSKFL